MDNQDETSSTDHADELSLFKADGRQTPSSRFQSIQGATDAEVLHVKNEDRAIRLSKWIVIAVLVTAAVTLGTGVFVFGRKNELHQFEYQVRTYE